jgi:hypothetical protein
MSYAAAQLFMPRHNYLCRGTIIYAAAQLFMPRHNYLDRGTIIYAAVQLFMLSKSANEIVAYNSILYCNGGRSTSRCVCRSGKADCIALHYASKCGK